MRSSALCSDSRRSVCKTLVWICNRVPCYKLHPVPFLTRLHGGAGVFTRMVIGSKDHMYSKALSVPCLPYSSPCWELESGRGIVQWKLIGLWIAHTPPRGLYGASRRAPDVGGPSTVNWMTNRPAPAFSHLTRLRRHSTYYGWGR